jgi:hypothetical protein
VTAVTYHLSTMPPTGSFIGVQDVTLLTGVEDDPDGGLRVYLGARHRKLYMLVEDEDAKETFRRAWGGGPHVWMWPVPPADAIFKDES